MSALPPREIISVYTVNTYTIYYSNSMADGFNDGGKEMMVGSNQMGKGSSVFMHLFLLICFTDIVSLHHNCAYELFCCFAAPILSLLL